MKLRVPFRLGLIQVLLSAGIVMNGLSAFSFIRLDNIVHGQLYSYGLQFSREWAAQYWTYSTMILVFLSAAIFLKAVSIAYIHVHAPTLNTGSRFAGLLFSVLEVLMTCLSAFSFIRLDNIVHGQLYSYGLQFSREWAAQYWTYSNSILFFSTVAIAAAGVTVSLIFLSAPVEIYSLVRFTLFLPGVIALALSLFYSSSILAFIGLGLIFWVAILFYVRPERYIKETLLDKTALPTLASLDQLIEELGYKGKGIYLPPRYLKDFESSKVYINARETENPSIEEIQDQESIFVRNPEGILMKPPGMELARLWEKMLGTSFTRVDLQYLEQKMPKLLIEDLEIAQKVEARSENNRFKLKIEESIYTEMCREVRKLSRICGSIGCPLCSAIACSLAKATGKPVMIETDRTSEDGRTIDIEFTMLEEPMETE